MVVTDSTEIHALVESWGGRALVRVGSFSNGTERVSAALSEIDADFVICLQADEIFLPPEVIKNVWLQWEDRNSELITAIYPIGNSIELFDSNVVKVARATDGSAIYFSRSAIPCLRDVPLVEWHIKNTYWGHIGIYGYSRGVLSEYAQLPRSALAEAESLEQLRLTDAGHRFRTVVMNQPHFCVDTMEQLERARLCYGRYR